MKKYIKITTNFSSPITVFTIRVEHYLYLIPNTLFILKMLREEFVKLDEMWKRFVKNDRHFYLGVFIVMTVLWILQILFVLVIFV